MSKFQFKWRKKYTPPAPKLQDDSTQNEALKKLTEWLKRMTLVHQVPRKDLDELVVLLGNMPDPARSLNRVLELVKLDDGQAAELRNRFTNMNTSITINRAVRPGSDALSEDRGTGSGGKETDPEVLAKLRPEAIFASYGTMFDFVANELPQEAAAEIRRMQDRIRTATDDKAVPLALLDDELSRANLAEEYRNGARLLATLIYLDTHADEIQIDLERRGVVNARDSYPFAIKSLQREWFSLLTKAYDVALAPPQQPEA